MAPQATDPAMTDGRGPDTELRIAVIMTGGVSLAVWMGGVAAELLHLADQDGPYAQLLAASGYDRVRVDVIAGTSAGGINGALLATATTWGVGAARFTQDLRTIWLEQGALESLLRSPFERDPDALLRGESYLLPHLRGLLAGWQPGVAERQARRRRYLDPAEPPTRLLMTGTLLEPTIEVYVTGGRPLAEPDHRGVFRFSGFDLLADHAPAQVARAARTSSSYPGAFEPSYLSLDGEVEDHLAGIANAGGYAIDGGVLVNRPFRLALDAVFGQRATQPVHRALLYVVPSTRSGPADDVGAEPAAKQRPEPPSFAAVLGRTAALPMTQTIRDDLDALAEHDRKWRHQRANRIGWIAALLPNQRAHLAETLWPEFTRRRAEASVDTTLRGVAERNPDLALDRHWATVRAGIEAGRRRADWHGPSFAASLPGQDEPRWWWGVSSLEYLFQVVLDLVRLTPDPRGAWRQRLHDALDVARAFQRLDALYWDAAFAAVDHDPTDLDAWADWAAERYAQWPAVTAPSSPRASASLRVCLARIRGQAESLDAAAQAQEEQATSADGAADAPAVLTQDEAADRLYTVAVSIAEVVKDWLTFAEGSAQAADQSGMATASNHLALADALRGGDGSVATILRTLLSFWVIQATTQHDRLEREQPIDLVPITSDGAVTVDPRRRDRPSQKLTGGQLANFGGFAKRSWRANDFLWGRLDAAEQIGRWLSDDPDASDRAARSRQEVILTEELPQVAAAIQASQEEGANHADTAASFLVAMEQEPALPVAELLAYCRVGEELLTDEHGSNAWIRTAATAAAGVTTILAGARGGVGWVRAVARRARRFVVLPVYLVVQATRAGNARGFVARLLALLTAGVRGLTSILRRR